MTRTILTSIRIIIVSGLLASSALVAACNTGPATPSSTTAPGGATPPPSTAPSMNP